MAVPGDHIIGAFSNLDITPTSRWPTTLPEATMEAVRSHRPPVWVHPVARQEIEGPLGLASIVIVTMGNLVYTKLCLETLLAHPERMRYEIIVVDNGSNDGTPDYLREMTRRCGRVRVVFNDCNYGFARATNQGLAEAHGDYLVLLNNDTLVPQGWLERLMAHLVVADVGLVGPTTNRSGNEAQINIGYRTYGDFVEFAQTYHQLHHPHVFDIRTAVMFCAAMRRELYQTVGPLDEQFEVGLFEDDDYAMRIRAAGYRVVCAEDIFVHHFGQASIGKLAATGEYGKLFHSNRLRWEKKWRQSWTPYRRRESPAYRGMIDRIRELVYRVVPREATVLVTSRGDEEFLHLHGLRAWHFPRNDGGLYAGHHPADSAEAIAHLEALRAKGGEFLLIPGTARWWLEYYDGFRQHLERRYRVVADEKETCLIVALRDPEPMASGMDGRRTGSETGGGA